jgi:hypothetical protein
MCIAINEENMQKLLGTSTEALALKTQYVRDSKVRFGGRQAWPMGDEYDDLSGWMKN